MSLKQLTNMHTIYRYPLTQTTDAMMDTVESIGTREATLKGRMVPGTAAGMMLDRRAMKEFDQIDLNEKYIALFASNPSLTLRKALVWDSKVWRIIAYINSSQMSWLWIAVVEHIPQVELSAP